MAVNPQEPFQAKILQIVKEGGLSFPGLDDIAILEQVVPAAEDWIIAKIASEKLSVEDQGLYRDAFMSAPDVFDPVEFLSDTVADFDAVFDAYFDAWCENFRASLSETA